MMRAKAEFQNGLIGRTIKYAADNVPGYSYLKDFCGRINTIEDMAAIPIVEKQTIIQDPDSFRNPLLRTSLIQHTSGTSGSVMIVQRSAEEVEFNLDFFSEINKGEAVAPICVALTAPSSHGQTSPMPYHGPVFSMDPFDKAWLEEAKNIVTAPLRYANGEGDDAILSGLESHLRLLTLYLLDHDFDFSCSHIRALYSTGDLITTRRRNWYESVWKAPLIDRYSMSEILAGAVTCKNCGYFHCDTHIVTEAVDPFTRKPVHEGLGVLIFTTLFPFVQKQPLIRYWSGDVVEVHTGCQDDWLGFRFKGRLGRCLLDNSGALAKAWLLGANLSEVLEAIPDVATEGPFGDTKLLSDPSALGQPKCSFSMDRASTPIKVTLRVELRYAPYSFPEHVDRLRARIEQDILTIHLHLANSVESGTARFSVMFSKPGEERVFRPGAIADDTWQ